MGAHGPNVGWKFLEKILSTECPMGINKDRISHHL
jgi:hypothetical protein